MTDPTPSLWSRFKARVGGWFGRPAPFGRWVRGGAWSLRGFIGTQPLVIPRRRFRLYVPRGWSRQAPAPLVALIHGCKQTSDEFALGTRIEALADRAGVLVLMPRQKRTANPYRCWNWFDRRTAEGMGEAAILAAMIRKVLRRYRADPARVVAAGISSGAGLAAILGVRFPGLVGGVVAHSGIACGAATSALTALAVMKRGPETDVAAIAAEARRASGTGAPVRLLVVQGSDDEVVAARNAAALARQFLALNGVDVPAGAATTLPSPDRDDRDATDLARVVRTREWSVDARPLVRLVEVEGLGHAWSGGDASLPFNDARPPDATAMLGAWLATA
jgi:poly(hydroxyalkanoate) depolymerase family esterase